ncbi:DUF979 domain-containing protein [Sorangium cellulosum]|uniref:Permease n=1 Tax=Sorangium cellulosum TaxID=56 RepID=A0A150QN29_SORCE|nr:DUF979 domain-containing protein [Sorangium cellulosum]KYF69397.1 hypothetical protein BE15_31585 [Sorangium cellulosum]
MITLDFGYAAGGLFFAASALLGAADSENQKRWKNALFWGLLATSFLFGPRLGDLGNGVLVIALVLLAGLGGLGQGRPATTTREERLASAERRGDRLFVPALIVPATALLGTLVLRRIEILGTPLLDPGQATLISLALGVVLALAASVAWLRPPLLAPLQEGRRLLDTVGWAAILPQMLAALGVVFAAAGVGDVVGNLAGGVIPPGSRFAAVAAYTVGMAVFTVIMGNAFAAFPVMTAAVGLPLLVRRFGGDPAIVCAIGMLSGFCGTLMTPMAANFNVVPAALLGLPDRDGVIKAQLPTALLLLVGNTLLLYLLAFPR